MVKFWLEEKFPRARFPIEAIRGGIPFPDYAPGLVCEALSLEEAGSWSFKLLHPDKDAGDRAWNTELAYRRTDGRILFGARASCSSPANRRLPASCAVPGVVRYALNRIGMRDCVPITCRPKSAASIEELLALKRLAADPARTLPVVVLSGVNRSERRSGILEEYALDPEQLADDLLGLAHVVKLPWQTAFEWTKAVGREWSVYNGAVRTYYPGLDFARDEPWDHPNVAAGKILSWRPNEDRGERGFRDFLRNRLRRYSGGRQVDWGNLLFIDDARTEKANLDYNRIYEQAIDDIDEHNQKVVIDMKAKFDAERASYRDKIKSLEREAEQFSDDALIMSGEVERYRRLNYSLRARIDALNFELRRLRGAGVVTGGRNPRNYEELEDWIIDSFPESIYLHPRAVRGLRNAEYEDVGKLCDAIRLLAGPYRDMRRGILPKAEFDEQLQSPHNFAIERSISESRAGEKGDMYFVAYPANAGNPRLLEWHLTHGNSYESRYCLRIYFFWDKTEEVVVIGWLPSHLDNRLT
ncbi:MAG: hypothetical protein LBT97_02770 [Planctomycetota bacterium]|nr:hypothetical protein [Planctomycetota bacterium]